MLVVAGAQAWWRRWDCRLARRAPRWARVLGRTRRWACALTDGSAGCSGSTLVFARYLRDRGIRVIWAYRDDPAIVPAWATPVRAGSARHRWLAARSRWWITDGLPLRVAGPDTVGGPLQRGRDTRVLVLLEPTVEKVGSDIVDWPLLTPRQQRRAQVRSETSVDVVAAPSKRVARALGLESDVVPVSPLPERVPERAAARERLGLPADAHVAAVVSVRDQAGRITASLNGVADLVVADAAGDPADLVAACDVLVTDTSPWAAVAARLGRPVIVFAPDLRDLLSRGPGLYVRWQHELPGPWAHDEVSMHAAMGSLREQAWQVPGEFADGHAALAALAGSREEGACDQLVAALEGDGR